MNKIWDIFDEEEEKKKSSVWDVFKVTDKPTTVTDVTEPTQLGIGAKAVGGATEDSSLHLVRNPYLVQINDLKSGLEKSVNTLNNYDNSLTELEKQFELNPTQELADQFNAILGKRQSLFKEYEAKGNNLDSLIDEYNKTVETKNEQIDVKYKQAFKKYKQETGLPSTQPNYYTPLPKPKPPEVPSSQFGISDLTPEKVSPEQKQIETLSLRMKELDTRKEQESFCYEILTGEKVDDIFTLPLEERKKALSLMTGLQRTAVTTTEKFNETVGKIGWVGAIGIMGAQTVAGLIKITPDIWRKLNVKIVDKKISFKEGLDAVLKVGHGEGTSYQRKIFNAVVKQADSNNISVVNMLKKGLTITEAQPRFAFGTKLYAGLPADEIVNAIVEVGKVSAELVKGLDPAKVSQVTQQLMNISPALASEFSKAIEKAEIEIPEVGAEMPKGINDLKKELAGRMTKERVFLDEIEKALGKKLDMDKSEDIQTALDYIKKPEISQAKPTPKKKFTEAMQERIDKRTQIPVEEPEPTPEEIKSVFMEEGNLETTAGNRELFYEKYNEVYAETKKGYDKLLENKIAELKEEGFKGVDKGGVKRDEEGYVIEKIPTVSRNPKWYRDFYALHNKKPSNKDLKEIAIKQLSEGHVEDYGKISPNEIFTKLEAQLDSYEAILSDIKGGDYSFETPQNITKLNDKLKDLAKENKKLIKDYESELTTLKAEKEGKFKELYKEAEAREKIGIEVGVKKGVEKVLTGKKLKGLSEEEYKSGNKIIGQIHKAVHDKGLTGKEFSEIKMKYGHAGKLSGKAKRMSLEQLQDVLKAVNRARPKIVEHKHVITPKTEKKIQSLKENLIGKLQMSEEKYQEVLKDVGVYKEPKYIDGKHFITETQGKDIIYRLIGESEILRETLPYDKAVEKLPAIKKLIDKERAIIGKYRDKGLRDPKELNSARVIFQKMEEITGAPIYRMYESLIDISLENKEKVAEFIHGFAEYKDIIRDKEAIKRVADYITSKSNLKDKPEYPSKITTQEIELAKKIEGVLRDYRARARTEKFLDSIDNLKKIPQYEEYKKEIDKALDIYESKGYDDLVEYMKTQEWGIIRNGYDPLQVVSHEIRQFKPAPQTFGKSHIKVRTDIQYHEQDKNVLERLFSYKKQMDNLVDMRPKVRAFITLIDDNIDKFHNPGRIKEGVEIFLRELKGYNKPEGLVNRELNRAYAQAMQVIILPSPAMFARNVLQPGTMGFDKSILIDPRNKSLTTDDKNYMNTYSSQMKAIKIDWFMVGEKPYFGKIGAGLMNIVNKVGIYPYSDQLNRITSFWARINQVRRAFEGVDKNSTEKELNKALIKAKFDDIERTERIMALEILGKDGKDAMARYVARVFTADTQFQYNRAERSFAEMGQGKWLTNLMLFPRSYNELLLKQAKHFKEGNIRQKARASKVFMSIIIGGMIMSAAYKKVTGRRKSPYGFLELLAYEPGGLAIGTIEAATDVYVNTIMAVSGDERAIAALTTAIPRLANMWIPFYDYTLRGYEAATNQKNVDVRALRKIREIFDKEYKTRGDAYELERNAFQKWQYFIAGAGVDVGIKEEAKKRKAIPKSDVWGEVEGKEEKSDVWGTFDTESKKGKSSVWDEF